MKKIAIIMTVHNRKNVTKTAIESITKANKNKYDLYFYITDDGSTDGTDKMLEELKEKYKYNTFIITKADGNEYWVGGMRISYEKALKNDNIDFYLWVNDDVDFFENFFEIIMNDYNLLQKKYEKFLITGAVKDKKTGKTTYGAEIVNRKKVYHNKIKLNPVRAVQECNKINGNCVLIDKKTAKCVGNIDGRFIHMFADSMYGFKLIDLGGKCFLASEYVGYCSNNSKKNTWEDENLSPIKRIKLKHGKKHAPPKLFIIFLKKELGYRWIIVFLYQYIRIFITSFKCKIKKCFVK